MEFEAADKAIARLTETASSFFGQDVAKAGLTGEFRGATTIDQQQRMLDNEARITELYGGKPPTIMSVSEFRASMNSVEGDANYNPAFDLDKDGSIGFQDWLEVTQQGTMMDDGRIAFGEGPRTIQGQQMDQQSAQFAETHGLNVDQFQEATRQFNEEIGQNMDQFMSSQVGQIMHTDENGNLVMDVDPNTGLPLTTLQRAALDVDKEQFNRSFSESIRQFGINSGFTQQGLDIENRKVDVMRDKDFAGAVGGAFSAYMAWLNRPK
jgi:hypothetical protein